MPGMTPKQNKQNNLTSLLHKFSHPKSGGSYSPTQLKEASQGLCIGNSCFLILQHLQCHSCHPGFL